jgi:hypothetical protein
MKQKRMMIRSGTQRKLRKNLLQYPFVHQVLNQELNLRLHGE